MKRLVGIVLAVGLAAGCTLHVSELETSVLWSRPHKAEAAETGLAMSAMRATCSLAECSAMLQEAGVEADQAARACVLAWLSEARPCGGEASE